MKTTMVIPSYWARERKVGWRVGDAVFDHPTPIDCDGTLLRAIQSINRKRKRRKREEKEKKKGQANYC